MAPLVHRLGYIALNVTDLEAAVQDAQQTAGLALVDLSADRALLTSNARHAEVIMFRADHTGLRRFGLEVQTPEQIDEITARARAAGVEVLSEKPSLAVISRAVTLRFAEGHVVEAHMPMPQDRSVRHIGPGIHPRYLDHVNLTATDPATASQQMLQVFGLLLSERTAGWELSWMRAGDGRHHTVGMAKSSQAGLHHYSWEFANFSDFKRLGDILDLQDRTLVWGPGRHGAGDNIFAYYVDAGGFLVECTCEMEMIDDQNREPRIVDPGENLSNYKVVNRWGQLPSEQWLQHFNACSMVGYEH